MLFIEQEYDRIASHHEFPLKWSGLFTPHAYHTNFIWLDNNCSSLSEHIMNPPKKTNRRTVAAETKRNISYI